MYQPQLGDRIKFTGYTPEAYKNGSVPTFMDGEGIIIELENKLYLKLDTEYIIPLYYLDNIECIKPTKTCKYFVENAEKCLAHLTQRNSCHTNYGCIFYKEVDLTKTEFKPKRVIEQDLTPEEQYYYSIDGLSIPEKCNGCDAWIDYTGTPAHCAVEKCLKESDITIVKKPLGQKISKDYWKDTIKELESEEKMFKEMEEIYQEKQKTRPIRRT